jgi:hypothetical protein
VADEMEVYPAQLATVCEQTDSLNETNLISLPELKRLKSIIDRRLAGDELVYHSRCDTERKLTQSINRKARWH